MKPAQPLRSIRFKIHAAIRSTVTCMAALTLVGLGGIATLAWAVHREVSQIEPAQRANASILQAMTDSETSIRGYQLNRDDTFLSTWTLAQAPLDRGLAELRGLAGTTSGLAESVARQEGLVAQWRTVYAIPIATGELEGLDRTQQTAARLAFERFRRENSGIAQWITVQRQRVVAVTLTTAWLTAAALLITAAVGVTIGLRPARRALRGVAPPLEAMQRVVGELREGHWDARVDPDAGVVEIRTIARALNELADSHQRAEKRVAEELRLTAAERDWGKAVHATHGLDAIFGATLKPLAEALRAGTVWIRTFEGATGLPGTGVAGHYPAALEWPEPPPHLIRGIRDLAQLCWTLHRPLVLVPGEIVPIAPGLASVMLDYVAPLGIETLLFVPIGTGDRSTGYVAFGRPTEAPHWGELEVNAAERMAKDLGRAVDNARAAAREQEVIAELRALDTRKSEFVSMVSHELRTPLASVTGHLEIVRSGDLGEVNDDIDHSLAAIERNSHRLTNLIEDLLLLSRIEEGNMPTTTCTVDLSALVAETVEMLEPQSSLSHVTIVVTGADHPQPMQGDPHEIERLVTNLLSNAIKFSPRGGSVELTIEPIQLPGRTEAVRLRVSDHGIGIDEADQAQLFTWFFRSTNAQAQAIPGTGLGLAIVKIIAERHGGSVSVDSTLGAGTTFTVDLPLAARGQREWIGRHRLGSVPTPSLAKARLTG